MLLHQVMEEDDNEMYKTHFAKYIDADVSAENMEETWQKVHADDTDAVAD